LNHPPVVTAIPAAVIRSFPRQFIAMTF
jgi:hypothetical protein